MDSIVVLADTQAVREINSAAVLATLRTSSPLSLAEISTTVGLSRQAVTRCVADLVEAGWVEYLAPSPPGVRAGRPAQLVRFRADIGHVIGICVSPQQVSVGVADLAGTVLATTRVLRGEGALDALVGAQLQEVLRTAGVDAAAVWFAAAGAPGIVDPDSGVISFVPSMPEIAGDSLHRILRHHLTCPIYIDNDIKLATWGEQWDADGDPAGSLVFVHWGTRVGAGIVLGGELYRGATNDAGDVGFLDLAADPADPKLGDRTGEGLGRFEQWVGTQELVRLATEQAQTDGDSALSAALNDSTTDPLRTLAAAAGTGNRAAGRVLAESARRFAIGLVAIRALLDPHVVVIGGTMAQFGDPLLDAVRAELNKHPLRPPTLRLSTLGDDAIVLGAIRHSLDLLDDHIAPGRRANQTG